MIEATIVLIILFYNLNAYNKIFTLQTEIIVIYRIVKTNLIEVLTVGTKLDAIKKTKIRLTRPHTVENCK